MCGDKALYPVCLSICGQQASPLLSVGGRIDGRCAEMEASGSAIAAGVGLLLDYRLFLLVLLVHFPSLTMTTNLWLTVNVDSMFSLTLK